MRSSEPASTDALTAVSVPAAVRSTAERGLLRA